MQIAFYCQHTFRTDTFTVTGPGTGPSTPPTICGTNNGEHSKLLKQIDKQIETFLLMQSLHSTKH